MADFNTTSTHKARVARTCYETGEIIAAGDRYTRFAGTHEGDFYCICMKTEVAEIFNRLNSESWKTNKEGIVFGGLIDYIYDSLNESSTPQQMADAKAIHMLSGRKHAWMFERIADVEAVSNLPVQ